MLENTIEVKKEKKILEFFHYPYCRVIRKWGKQKQPRRAFSCGQILREEEMGVVSSKSCIFVVRLVGDGVEWSGSDTIHFGRVGVTGLAGGDQLRVGRDK